MTPGPDRRRLDRALSVHAAAEERPDHPALIAQDGRRWSWSELSAEVSAVEPGIVPGSQVLAATSTPETVFRILASIARAKPAAPIDPRISVEERRARVELLETDPGLAASANATRSPSPDDRRPLAVLFTSGSTGTPRAVELSRTAFVESAGASEDRLGWEEDDRWLCVLPLAHVGGFSILTRCLIARRTIVLLERFDAGLVREVIEREAVTIASFVPTMLSRLLARDPGRRAPASLRVVLLGGAPAPDALWSDALHHGYPALETWGMTETCSQIATAIPGRAPRAPVPLRGWSVRSRNGRLEVNGPSLLTRYLEEGGAGSSEPPVDPDGWFATGDLGTVNTDGSVSIGGRADEVIITGGENVSPTEVERVLEAVPGVRRAVVVGIPDSEWGETVAAALEIEPGRLAEPTAETRPFDRLERDLQGVMDERLAPFTRPRTIVWVQRLPETAAGKVDRAAVRRRILDERLTSGH